MWVNNELGFNYSRLESYHIAVNYFKKALEMDKDNLFALSRLAWAYSCLNKHQLALEYYQLCEPRMANNDWLISNLGYTYFELGDLTNAEKYLLQAKEMDSESQWVNDQLEKLRKAKKKKKSIFAKRSKVS